MGHDPPKKGSPRACGAPPSIASMSTTLCKYSAVAKYVTVPASCVRCLYIKMRVPPTHARERTWRSANFRPTQPMGYDPPKQGSPRACGAAPSIASMSTTLCKYNAVAKYVTVPASYVRRLPLGDRAVELHLVLAKNEGRVCFRT